MSCLYANVVPDVTDYSGSPVYAPCGHCFACRLALQTSLVNRMFCAWRSHNCSAFVTFTYDDDHLIVPDGTKSPTLSKEDVHRYLDKIRHMLKGTDFEYFLCGEYGDNFGRPHYHAVFFGLDFEYHSKFFKRSWTKGSVKVLPVTSQSFRYVSKYLTQSIKNNGYFDLGILPPFYKMSRGLGSSLYLKHLDAIREHGFFRIGSRKIYPSRYYFNKLIQFDSDLVDFKDFQRYASQRNLLRDSKLLGADYCSYKVYKAVCFEEAQMSKYLNNFSR